MFKKRKKKQITTQAEIDIELSSVLKGLNSNGYASSVRRLSNLVQSVDHDLIASSNELGNLAGPLRNIYAQTSGATTQELAWNFLSSFKLV